jgi:uncharacterized protein
MGTEPSGSAGVGSVARLWRYPVKSMSAEALDDIELSWAGLAGDRRWAFLRAGSEKNGFPWQTIRENPEMGRYRPRLTHPDRPDKSAVEVRAPNGDRYDISDPALASLVGDDVRLMRLDRGAFDAMPLSIISTQTVSAICELASVAVDALRFRPNLLVNVHTDEPYLEDEWVGSDIRIGGARIRVDRQDSRCVVVNVDPATAEKDQRVLKVIGQHRGAALGVYGTVVEPGLVRIGDPVILLR